MVVVTCWQLQLRPAPAIRPKHEELSDVEATQEAYSPVEPDLKHAMNGWLAGSSLSTAHVLPGASSRWGGNPNVLAGMPAQVFMMLGK